MRRTSLASLRLPILMLLLAVALACCNARQPQIVVITATFAPPGSVNIAGMSGATPTPLTVLNPSGAANTNAPANGEPGTLAAPGSVAQSSSENAGTQTYTIQAGDTLNNIAARNGTTADVLLRLNNLTDPDRIEVGQVMILPDQAILPGSSTPILPDTLLVRGPGSERFDVADFIGRQSGYLRAGIDLVDGNLLTAAQVVERVSLEFSVDARVLLALLELRSRLLTNPAPGEDERTYALRAPASRFGFARNGLYRQLAWAADQLNAGYYGWKYRALKGNSITLDDGRRVQLAPDLNAGSAALQAMLSQYATQSQWTSEVANGGFSRVYRQLFGDPFASAPPAFDVAALIQPELALPFPDAQTWYFTGGPHGGWGGGSAWAAVDFAPPDDPDEQTSGCYISDFTATAAASGVIARAGGGSVVLDLDGDGNESTGWTLLYLHISSDNRIAQGTRVSTGDPIGYPSCEGGVSNGTHMHIARRYNGEWLPADCTTECTATTTVPAFNMEGWMVSGLRGQEYQGYLVRDGIRKVAEAMRGVADNRISGA